MSDINVLPQPGNRVVVTSHGGNRIAVVPQPANRVVIASPGPQGPGGGGSGGAGEGVSVTAYGATGDGSTDDTTAIQAAINAAGTGGRVFFPDGVYLLSAPLRPQRSQILEGVYSTKYEAGEFPWGALNGSILRADPNTFTGDAVIVSEPSAYGVTISRLAIVGPGGAHPSIVHGIYFGASASGAGERAWTIRDSLVNSCSGDGICGHMWVFDARDVHISQCRNGIATFDNDGFLDTRVIGCNIYFNRSGGIVLNGGYSGAINIIGCRVERSGNTYGDPATPINTDAPGIEIRVGRKALIANVDTDSNTGPGLRLGNPNSFVHNITVTGSHFNRDGGASQTGYESRLWVDVGTPETPLWEYQIVPDGTPGADRVSTEGVAGVDLDDCSNVRLVGCSVSYGAANDSDPNGILSPQYGIRLNETNNVEVSATTCLMPVNDWSIKDEGTNSTLSLTLPEQQLLTLPVAGEAQWLPTFGGIGSIAYQNDLQTIVFRNYAGQWLRAVATDGVNPIRLSAIADLREATPNGIGSSALRIVKGGTDDTAGDGLLRWSLSANPQATGFTFYLGRYGDDGQGDLEAYLDSPISVNWSTGRVDLNQTYIVPNDDYPAITAKAAAGQAAPLVVWQDETGAWVGGVTADGRAYGAAATQPDNYVTKAQLDAAGGGGGDGQSLPLDAPTSGDYAWIEFKAEGVRRWEVSSFPSAMGSPITVSRFDASGNYLSTPLAISNTTGQVDLHRTYIAAPSPSDIPLAIRSAASPTVSHFRVEANDGSPHFEVLWDGTVRAKWGSGSFAAVQQGCTQIVREGASPGNTMFGVYTSTANADADSSVFEVYGSGSVKIAPAEADGEALQLGQLKAVVAASSDFADFKARMAAL